MIEKVRDKVISDAQKALAITVEERRRQYIRMDFEITMNHGSRTTRYGDSDKYTVVRCLFLGSCECVFVYVCSFSLLVISFLFLITV